MSAHESMEHAEHAEHASGSNRKIALLIAIIALCLALSETLGKGAQTESISKNVEASNLWAFFQAKSIRRTQIQTAAATTQGAMPTEKAGFASPGGRRLPVKPRLNRSKFCDVRCFVNDLWLEPPLWKSVESLDEGDVGQFFLDNRCEA